MDGLFDRIAGYVKSLNKTNVQAMSFFIMSTLHFCICEERWTCNKFNVFCEELFERKERVEVLASFAYKPGVYIKRFQLLDHLVKTLNSSKDISSMFISMY